MLLTFAGPAALSDFRRSPLLQRCRALLPDLTDLQAEYFYIVQLQRPLDAAARQRLSNILDVENEFQPQSDSTVLVCPRPGTISPWSSKAVMTRLENWPRARRVGMMYSSLRKRFGFEI